MGEKFQILHQQNPSLPKIYLFLLFLKGDKRIPEGFRWSMSIQTKIKDIEIMFKEVETQIPLCIKELENAEKEGYTEGIECLKLARKYEVFLNSIYALCENLSRIVAYLYSEHSLPHGFREQKKRFLEKHDIDPAYSKILEEFTNWYSEVHSIRTESTHFLSGFITISESEIGYFNTPKSKRKDSPKKIDISDIEKHIKQVYYGVMAFLSEFGKHFINVIDEEPKIALLCLSTSSGYIGAKQISLREYKAGEAGICLTPDTDCPLKESCEAYKNYVESNNI